jgi:hypothetical protein
MSEKTRTRREDGKVADKSESPAESALADRLRAPARTSSRSSRKRDSAATGTVTMQARVDASFASELLELDAPVLGLLGASALVREGLRLVHKRARELAVAAEYDKFYGGQPAPSPAGVSVMPADAG